MPGGEYINHFNAVRLRATGAGNLQMKLNSIDSVYTETLVPLVLESATERYKTQLANFSEQKAQLEIWTDEIDEVFLIRQITIYHKPIFSSYPQ